MENNMIFLVNNEDDIRKLTTRSRFKFYCKKCGKEVIMKYCGLHFIDRYKNMLCRKCSFNLNYDKDEASTKRVENWFNKSDEERLNILLKRSITRKNRSDVDKNKTKEKIANAWKNKSPDEISSIVNSAKQTRLEKYGDENYNNRDQCKLTNLERYGVENVMQNDIVKGTLTNTFKNKYNVNSVGDLLSIDEYSEKAKQTKFEKYGNENYNNPEKRCETNVVKYGTPCTLSNPDIVERSKQTKLEKYGDENYNNPEKSKQTKLEKYGDENYHNIEKAKQTTLKRYGNENYRNIEKSKQTKLEKYGNENYHNIEKAKNTMIQKYGKDNYMRFGSPERANIINTIYNNIDLSNTESAINKRKETCFEKYNSEYYINSNQHKDYMLSKYGTFSPTYKYNYYGAYFDSTWELALWIYAKDHNEEIIREPIELEFEYCGKKHYCYPDFKYKGKLIEIKGDQFFKEDGTMYLPYRRPEWSDEEYKFQCDLYEAKHQCMIKNNVSYLLMRDCKKYINYCIDKFRNKEWYLNYLVDNVLNPSYMCFNVCTNGEYTISNYIITDKNAKYTPFDIINSEDEYCPVEGLGLSPFDI